MTGASCPAPAGPVPLEALAEEMFALARDLRATAQMPRAEGELIQVRPEAVARIAVTVGRLAQAAARADQAYAEGARHGARAAAEAQRQSAVPGVTLDWNGRRWDIGFHAFPDGRRREMLTIELCGGAERNALEDLLTAARFRGGLTLGLAESKGGET